MKTGSSGSIIFIIVIIVAGITADLDQSENAGSPLLSRVSRQVSPVVPVEDGAGCTFTATAAGDVDTCNIATNMDKIANVSQWEGGTGAGSNWVGGAPVDGSGSAQGGYAFVTISEIEKSSKKEAWMFTAPQDSTTPDGKCLTFKYIISGMDLDCLSVYLVEYDSSAESTLNLSAPFDAETSNLKTTMSRLSCEVNEFPDANGWSEKKITYSWKGFYSIGFVASLNTNYPMKRGYVAVDDINFTDGPCDYDCNFDTDFCGWTQSTDDNFDWSLGRGSVFEATGPSKDHMSSLNNNIKTGGYAFIRSGWPRRPGDSAILSSASITATDQPMCLSFWINLHGGSIGDLRVYKVIGSEKERLWDYSGNERNSDLWNLAQLTLAGAVGTDYNIEFEALVGEPGAGDIAIDSIKINKGSCPRMPSGSDPDSVDCTFFEDSCSWRGIEFSFKELPNSSYPMVSRVAGTNVYPQGHTRLPYNTSDMYIRFDLGSFWHGARHKSALMSKELSPNKDEPKCLSFWYYMTTGSAMETTRVSALSVMLLYKDDTNQTIWHIPSEHHSRWHYAQVTLTMLQTGNVAIVGTKGHNVLGAMIGIDDIAIFSGECETVPPAATYNEVDCSFDVSICDWSIRGESNNWREEWRYIEKDNVLQDHTYASVTGGYLFIEAFSKSLSSTFVSKDILNDKNYCFTFYFAAYYKDNTAKLSVLRKVESADAEEIWSVTQKDIPEMQISTGGTGTVKWIFAQIPLEAASTTASSLRLEIQGDVTMGAWTVDDIKLIEETELCQVRPTSLNNAPDSAPPPTDGTM